MSNHCTDLSVGDTAKAMETFHILQTFPKEQLNRSMCHLYASLHLQLLQKGQEGSFSVVADEIPEHMKDFGGMDNKFCNILMEAGIVHFGEDWEARCRFYEDSILARGFLDCVLQRGVLDVHSLSFATAAFVVEYGRPVASFHMLLCCVQCPAIAHPS